MFAPLDVAGIEVEDVPETTVAGVTGVPAVAVVEEPLGFTADPVVAAGVGVFVGRGLVGLVPEVEGKMN